MALAKIKKGDEVIVIAGRDKGKRGVVTRVLPKQKLIVEGINLVTHYVRKDPQRNINGGLQRKEAPIAASNVQLVNPATGKGERVAVKTLEDGTKVRWFKKTDEMVPTNNEQRG